MLPSSTDLIYFSEIAKLGNLSHAATKIGVSQPSLTLAMQRLEQCLNTQLFIRSRQGVKLTKAGEHLHAETRNLLNHWDKVRQDADERMTQVRGQFSLGCHVAVAQYSLPQLLPSLLHRHPNLEVHLSHDLSRNITHRVQALQLDMGIVVNPTSHPDLIIKSLGRDTVQLWQAKGLQNPDVLVCEPELLQTQALLAKLRRQGLHFRRTIESSSLQLIAELTAQGAGVGILPSRVAETASRPLTRVKDSPTYSDEISLIYRVENRKVRALQVLSEAIQVGFGVVRR